jgi:hypothetical protein
MRRKCLRVFLNILVCRDVENDIYKDFFTTSVTVVNFIFVSLVLSELFVAMLVITVERIRCCIYDSLISTSKTRCSSPQLV